MQNSLLKKSMEMNILFNSQILLIVKDKNDPVIYCSEDDIEIFLKNNFRNKFIWKKILTNKDVKPFLHLVSNAI